MAKYLIHACNNRMWYVEEYLVPSMLEQGIAKEDIQVYLDKNGDGCLKSFIESGKQMCNDNGTWHLQDDVLICRDFKEQTEKLDEGVVCAFTSFYDDNQEPGWGIAKGGMWWSFPCIRIPDSIMKEFVTWVDIYVWRDPQYGRYVKSKKFDDLIFKIFMESYHPNDKVLRVAPNLVEHIDYLIGGTVVNPQRQMPSVRSAHWSDEELVTELERKLKERGKK